MHAGRGFQLLRVQGAFEACAEFADPVRQALLDGVEIGVLIENRAGALKGSLRAKDPKYRVDQIAKQFGGGGHACAAGLNVDNSSIKEFYPQLMQAIGEHLQNL
jgi:phosphoesterase RecJ-like protein